MLLNLFEINTNSKQQAIEFYMHTIINLKYQRTCKGKTMYRGLHFLCIFHLPINQCTPETSTP